MLSQEAPENSVLTALRDQLELEEIWPVHRLDKAVGGVMVFALSARAAASLGKAVQDQQLQKTYYAVLSGVPTEPEGILTDLLFHDKSKNKNRMRKGVKSAKLSYCVKQTSDDRALVHVKLFTGRTHQIRVQFSSRGLALIGDGKYGEKTRQMPVGLWSCSLRFDHPITGKKLYFFQRPPQTVPWSGFDEEAFVETAK